MTAQVGWGALIGLTLLGIGLLLGTVGTATYIACADLNRLVNVDSILAATVALTAAAIALYGVYLQVNSTYAAKRDEQVAAADTLDVLLTQQIRDILHSMEYNAEFVSTVPITAPKVLWLALIMSNRLLSTSAADAVKRGWEDLSKVPTERRVDLARQISVLDTLGKSCQHGAFSLDAMKDYQPGPGEMSQQQFIVHQRDTIVGVFRTEEKLEGQFLDQVHEQAKVRVAQFAAKDQKSLPA